MITTITEYKKFNENINVVLESANSFTITKEMYDYLLPVYGLANSDNGFSTGTKLFNKADKYYFIGTDAEYKEALERCKYL